jgi:hypothetical protein
MHPVMITVARVVLLPLHGPVVVVMGTGTASKAEDIADRQVQVQLLGSNNNLHPPRQVANLATAMVDTLGLAMAIRTLDSLLLLPLPWVLLQVWVLCSSSTALLLREVLLRLHHRAIMLLLQYVFHMYDKNAMLTRILATKRPTPSTPSPGLDDTEIGMRIRIGSKLRNGLEN